MSFIKICFSLILVFGFTFQSERLFLSQPETLAPKGEAWEKELAELSGEIDDFLNKKATFVLFVVDEIFENKKIANRFPEELTTEMNEFKNSIPYFNLGNQKLPLSEKYVSIKLAEKILTHFEKKPLDKELIYLELINPPKWKKELQNHVQPYQLKMNGEFHKNFSWLNLHVSVEQAL